METSLKLTAMLTLNTEKCAYRLARVQASSSAEAPSPDSQARPTPANKAITRGACMHRRTEDWGCLSVPAACCLRCTRALGSSSPNAPLESGKHRPPSNARL